MLTWNERMNAAVDWFDEPNHVLAVLTISRDAMKEMWTEAESNPESVDEKMSFMAMTTYRGFRIRMFLLPVERQVAFLTTEDGHHVCPLMRGKGDPFPPPKKAGLLPQPPFGVAQNTWRQEDLAFAFEFMLDPKPPKPEDLIGEDEEE